MKLSDAIGLVLKSKDENRVLSITPDQSVYEAIEKMPENGTRYHNFARFICPKPGQLVLWRYFDGCVAL